MDRGSDTPTAEQIRAGIDGGRGGDKVDFPDPAAVPLGADAEAGGTPPTAQELRLAARSELAGPAIRDDRTHNPRPTVAGGLIGAGVGVAAALAVAGLLIGFLG